MQQYSNPNANAGVVAYEAGINYIDIEFHDGSTYRYDYRNPGKREVKEMKRLAASGKGLTTFINQQVRENYAAKLK